MKLFIFLCAITWCIVSAKLIRYDLVEDPQLLGQDGHDMHHHGQEDPQLLGRDGHDMHHHGQHMHGREGHEHHNHGMHMMGKDGHDQRPHGMHMLGGDGHDQRTHGKQTLGGDGHDQQPHGRQTLGGDGHDQQPHGRQTLGGDGHDQQPHGRQTLGGDGHDQQPHGRPLLGGDDHDRQPHGKRRLGGDGHDKKEHKKKTGDKKAHKKHMLGQDDHDYQKHGKKLLGGVHDLGHIGMFKVFMKEHGKTYTNQEFRKRYKIFRQNMKQVHILQQSEKGTAKYGSTKFADLTQHEFRRMLGFRPDLKPQHSSLTSAPIPDVKMPVEFDWRDHGIVTPVKNQGMCGSCWAFSTTGNVEGQWAIKHQQLFSLSEQELVDCDKTDEGCNGGLPENAYEAINKLGGLETETDYPYEGDDEQCHFNKSMVKVTVNGSVELPQDELSLAKWLFKNGPISIGINANALQFYVGGVSHPLKFLCNPKNLDHGMLIVGFGVHTTKYLHRKQPYWIVKNSWGTDWGEQGYYRVYRGDGTCGVNMMATSGIVP